MGRKIFIMFVASLSERVRVLTDPGWGSARARGARGGKAEAREEARPTPEDRRSDAD